MLVMIASVPGHCLPVTFNSSDIVHDWNIFKILHVRK